MISARIAPVVVGVALMTSSCGLSFHNLPLTELDTGPSYRITAVFSELTNLPVGGEVKIGQSTVGRVSAVSTRDFQAVVQIDMNEAVRLPVGTTARLELTSALGEEYVMLKPSPDSGSRIEEGGTIPRESTSRGPDMESTLAALGAMLNGSGLEQARTIVSELHTALAGREQKVRDMLHQLDTLLATIDQHSQDFDVTIHSLRQLSADTAANKPVLEAAMTDITPAIDVLLGQREQFTRLLGDVTNLSRSANGVVQESGPAFTHQLDQLRPTLGELAGFNQRMGGTLAQLQAFERNLGSAIPGDYLNLDGTLDVSGTILPLLTGSAPPPESAPPGDAGGLLSGGTR